MDLLHQWIKIALFEERDGYSIRRSLNEILSIPKEINWNQDEGEVIGHYADRIFLLNTTFRLNLSENIDSHEKRIYRIYSWREQKYGESIARVDRIIILFLDSDV